MVEMKRWYDNTIEKLAKDNGLTHDKFLFDTLIFIVGKMYGDADRMKKKEVDGLIFEMSEDYRSRSNDIITQLNTSENNFSTTKTQNLSNMKSLKSPGIGYIPSREVRVNCVIS